MTKLAIGAKMDLLQLKMSRVSSKTANFISPREKKGKMANCKLGRAARSYGSWLMLLHI